jgi:type II secretory pathway predicted ATPase ExeA
MKFAFFGDKLPIEQYSASRIVMYETHFGLNKKPFRALASGSDVFVGPQTATTMAGLKKALTAADSIVAVSGPTGSGKTTLVRRALDAIGDHQLVISIGRIQLGHDEVLELLLEEMGVEVPAGTVQRFTAFRRLLRDQRDKGSRVFVVVEDAARVGIDALSELEALTATDAGVSDGASIVLMGDEDLDDILDARRLVRLKQRLKLRQKLLPLSAGELTAYFKHCFRLAGNEFDAVFEPGTADVLHTLSGGIPRVANNLVESALLSAAENNQQQVGVATIKLVATEEFGLDTGVQISEQNAAVTAAPELQPPAAAAADVESLEAVSPEVKAPAEQEPQEAVPDEVAPVEVAAEEATPDIEESEADDEIPELIQDTLPDLAILAPALANPPAAEQPAVDQVIETAAVEEDTDEPIPTLSDSVDGEIPPWEKDPTLAQLRPDLDALEHAMAVAQGLEPDDDDDSEQAGGTENIPELVPEITLDREIQAKIDEAAEELKKAEQEEAEGSAEESDDKTANAPEPVVEASVAPKPPPAPAAPKPAAAPVAPAQPQPVVAAAPVATAQVPEPQVAVTPVVEPPVAKAPVTQKPVVELPVVVEDASDDDNHEGDPELEKIAVNLARAKTIDDCDDKMAETLFGEEFSMMAAQVAANAPAELSANDELELAVTDFDGAAAVNVEIKSESNFSESNVDGSASQRLRTVRALNADPNAVPHVNGMNNVPPPVPPVAAAPVEPGPSGDQPQSIEDQINTSMTQTLEALSVRPDVHDDDDDEDSKGGFFSRFRRS